MSFTKPTFPDVDPEKFLRKPPMVHTMYIAKLAFFYTLG
jgi:hypothetical protein